MFVSDLWFMSHMLKSINNKNNLWEVKNVVKTINNKSTTLSLQVYCKGYQKR